MLSTENKNFVKRQRFCHFFPLVSVSDFVTLGLSRGSAPNPVQPEAGSPFGLPLNQDFGVLPSRGKCMRCAHP